MKRILFWFFFMLVFSSPLFSYDRIVSLTPSITETLFMLGQGEKVVGVTRFCVWPEEALKKKKLGGFLDRNYEALIRLEPDLVLVLDADQEGINTLKKLKLPYSVVTQNSLSFIRSSVLSLGRTLDCESEALKLVKNLDHDLLVPVRTNHKPSMLIIIGSPEDSLFPVHAAGQNGLYDEIIQATGFSNAYHGPKIPYPQIGLEGIMTLQPDLIVELFDNNRSLNLKKRDKLWKRYGMLQAVQNDNVRFLERDYSTIPSPRIFQLIRDLKELQ